MLPGLKAQLMLALGGGVLSALFYLSVLFGGPGALILGYLAPLPLFLAGLWLGSAISILAGLAGAVVVWLTADSALVAGTYLVSGALPAAVVVRQALLARALPGGDIEWYPPGRLLMVLTGLGLAGFAGAVFLTLDQPDGLEGVVKAVLASMAGQMFMTGGQTAPDADAFWLASVLPGIAALSWLIMTIVNAVLAQGVLMRFRRNQRPPMRLAEVEIPGWLVPAFLAASLGAAVAPDPVGFYALNVALILALPLAFAGLAVVHVVARSRSAKMPVLIAFYMFLFLFGWPIILVIGLGMIEQWIGLRRRFRPAHPDQEDE